MPENYTTFNDSVIRVKIRQSEYATYPYNYTWKIEMMTNTEMIIKINFTNPLAVSTMVFLSYNYYREKISFK